MLHHPKGPRKRQIVTTTGLAVAARPDAPAVAVVVGRRIGARVRIQCPSCGGAHDFTGGDVTAAVRCPLDRADAPVALSVLLLEPPAPMRDARELAA